MICKEGAIDVIGINGGTANEHINGVGTTSQQPPMLANGFTTLQNRRKSQLITFSASSCDIKNSLSHEIIVVGNGAASSHGHGSGSGVGAGAGAGGGSGSGGGGGGAVTGTNGIASQRGSIVGSMSNTSAGSRGNVRLSFAEEDIRILSSGNGAHHQQLSVHHPYQHKHQRHASGSTGSANGSAHGEIGELGEDEVFRRRSLEGEDEEGAVEELVEEEEDELFNDEFETHIETKSNNANDDSGGGSYEDSHALHSSLGGSNRNSLEKDDDDIDVDVISTDVSCYDQLLGSSCNTRNGDDDDLATLVGDGEHYTKLCKASINGLAVGGLASAGIDIGIGVGVGEGFSGGGGCGGGGVGGIIYANPFMDDEGIAESGM